MVDYFGFVFTALRQLRWANPDADAPDDSNTIDPAAAGSVPGPSSSSLPSSEAVAAAATPPPLISIMDGTPVEPINLADNAHSDDEDNTGASRDSDPDTDPDTDMPIINRHLARLRISPSSHVAAAMRHDARACIAAYAVFSIYMTKAERLEYEALLRDMGPWGYGDGTYPSGTPSSSSGGGSGGGGGGGSGYGLGARPASFSKHPLYTRWLRGKKRKRPADAPRWKQLGTDATDTVAGTSQTTPSGIATTLPELILLESMYPGRVLVRYWAAAVQRPVARPEARSHTEHDDGSSLGLDDSGPSVGCQHQQQQQQHSAYPRGLWWHETRPSVTDIALQLNLSIGVRHIAARRDDSRDKVWDMCRQRWNMVHPPTAVAAAVEDETHAGTLIIRQRARKRRRESVASGQAAAASRARKEQVEGDKDGDDNDRQDDDESSSRSDRGGSPSSHPDSSLERAAVDRLFASWTGSREDLAELAGLLAPPWPTWPETWPG